MEDGGSAVGQLGSSSGENMRVIWGKVMEDVQKCTDLRDNFGDGLDIMGRGNRNG